MTTFDKTITILIEKFRMKPADDILAKMNSYKNTQKRKARLKEQEKLLKVDWFITHSSLLGHYPQQFNTAKTMPNNPKWQDKVNVLTELRRLGKNATDDDIEK